MCVCTPYPSLGGVSLLFRVSRHFSRHACHRCPPCCISTFLMSQKHGKSTTFRAIPPWGCRTECVPAHAGKWKSYQSHPSHPRPQRCLGAPHLAALRSLPPTWACDLLFLGGREVWIVDGGISCDSIILTRCTCTVQEHRAGAPTETVFHLIANCRLFDATLVSIASHLQIAIMQCNLLMTSWSGPVLPTSASTPCALSSWYGAAKCMHMPSPQSQRVVGPPLRVNRPQASF